MSSPSVILDENAKENGLAMMLADLINQNLEQNPAKHKVFRRINSVVAITAADAEVSLTMYFNRGSCLIFDGKVGNIKLDITTDSETLLGLTTVPLRAGLPDPLSQAGRTMLKDIASGKIKIRGLVGHPLTLVLFSNLLSVN